MNSNTQPENKQEIVNNKPPVTNPTETTPAIREQKGQTEANVQPAPSKTGTDNQEKEVNNKNLQNDQKILDSADQLNNVQKEEKEQKAQLQTQAQAQPDKGGEIVQEKKDNNQKVAGDQAQQTSTQNAVPRKESQSKSQVSKDKPKEQKTSSASSSQNEIKAEAQRSEVKKETVPKPKKKDSQDLKQKDTKDKVTADDENRQKPLTEVKTTPAQKQEHKPKPEPTIGGAFASILSFFTATKNNLESSSSKTVSKLQEVVLQSKIVATITGTEYKPLTSSDLFKKEEAKQVEPENQKNQRSRTNRAQGQKKSTKVDTESSNKALTTEPVKEKKLDSKESKTNIKKVISKPKPAEGSGSSPLKGKNEVEEQIRVHKIQEVKKMKRALLEKLDALNNQLFELEKPGLDSNREANSPTRIAFNLEEYKKQQKEDLELKKKQALEFTRKMNQERKEMEQKRQKKRDDQNALVMKDIDVLYQKQLDELATSKGGGSAKAKYEENIKKFKQDNMFAALEEKKKSLKIMREFKKISDEPVNKEEANDDDQGNVEKKKIVKKPLYKSPVLAQILKEDEVIKKQEAEKSQAKKDLYKKKLEYAKEVKSSYLPQVHASKYTFDPEGRIARVVHRSQNIEKNLIRNAGKDALYGYLDKMRNKYPDISKPRKNSEDDSHVQDRKHGAAEGYEKAKKSKLKAKQRQEEEDEDYYGEEDMKNYELDEDVTLTDRADRNEFSSDFQSKSKGVKNLKNKSYQSDLKRRSAASEERLSDSDVEERNFESHSKVVKKHQVAQRDEEDDQWEEELKNDQLILKDKISNMLGDIKKMEAQMKQKEQKLLEDIDKRKTVNP